MKKTAAQSAGFKKVSTRKRPMITTDAGPQFDLVGHLIQDAIPSISAAQVMASIRQCEAGDPQNLFALYRDVIASDSKVQGSFHKRVSAFLSDKMVILPKDKGNPEDVAAADFLSSVLDESDNAQFLSMNFSSAKKDFFGGLVWLMSGTLYPCAVLENIFKHDPDLPASTPFGFDSFIAIDPQMLSFRTQYPQIAVLDTNGRMTGEYVDIDPNRYILHRGHTSPAPDSWGGPLRTILFWWLLRTMSRQWWAQLLQKFGVPFLIGTFNNATERATLQQAFSAASRLGGIAVNKDSVVRAENALANNGDSFKIFQDYCNREISDLICGETLASTPDPTGLNSGVATMQADVAEYIAMMDAQTMRQTLITKFFNKLLFYNNLDRGTITISFGSETQKNISSLVALLTALRNAGLELDDAAVSVVSERVGFGLRRFSQAMIPAPVGMSVQPNGEMLARLSQILQPRTRR